MLQPREFTWGLMSSRRGGARGAGSAQEWEHGACTRRAWRLGQPSRPACWGHEEGVSLPFGTRLHGKAIPRLIHLLGRVGYSLGKGPALALF